MLHRLIEDALGTTAKQVTTYVEAHEGVMFRVVCCQFLLRVALGNERISQHSAEFFGERMVENWKVATANLEKVRVDLAPEFNAQVAAAVLVRNTIGTLRMAAVRQMMNSESDHAVSLLCCTYKPVYFCMEAWHGLGMTGLSAGEALRTLIGDDPALRRLAQKVDPRKPHAVELYLLKQVKEVMRATAFEPPVPPSGAPS